MPNVDVVVPVYRGLEETRRCIDSVLASVDPEAVRLVLVNDASPEPEVGALLRDYAARHANIALLENPENRGFVATANRGMAHDDQRDVVLLNSDVEVANDWLIRLQAAAYSADKVGSVTPFANNATITSFPNLCKDNELLFDLPLAEVDAHFATRPLEDSLWQIPSGIGCCMYLRRDCLNAIGLFDLETFGRGYGEENDWCQRAQQAGWPNYHLGNCFIYHKGGVSFAEEQGPRITRALEILDQRYPRYHADIQRYIGSDPARPARTEAILALFARVQRPKILAISHKLGGGAQQHVDELASFYAADALFLQLTPEQEGRSVTLSFFDRGQRLQDGLHFDVDAEYDKLVALLRELGVGHVHFHHTMGLHPRLWVLGEALGCSHDLTVHDYYLVNGNPTLTDADAFFVEESAPDFDQRCAGHYPLPEGLSAADWRANQALLIDAARHVIFPSADCAARFQRFFEVAHPVTAWHPDYLASQPYPAPTWRHTAARPLRVLVLGAISREKGADVLEAVAEALADAPVEMHLLGYAYRALSERVLTHGPYDNREVYRLVEELQPDVVWYPALWPETYSYTLSVALHLSLPVVVPDLGAFAERVAGRPLSAVCAWDRSIQEWQGFWREVAEHGLPSGAPAPVADPARPAADGQAFYASQYLEGIAIKAGSLAADTLASVSGNCHLGVPTLSGSERILGRIWRLSRRPAVAKVLSLVPFRVQRAIKRRLSARPMHDIVR